MVMSIDRCNGDSEYTLDVDCSILSITTYYIIHNESCQKKRNCYVGESILINRLLSALNLI
jgi:hypothetical protein